MCPTLYKNVIGIGKISVYVFNGFRDVAIEYYLNFRVIRDTESHNDTMHMGFKAGFAVPPKRPMSKVNMYAKPLKQRLPHPSDLFALSD